MIAPARQVRLGQGSNSVQVRQYNERIVLQALRRFGAASKADLARFAGLTNNAVGGIITELAAMGLVLGGCVSFGTKPPPQLLTIRTQAMVNAGQDIRSQGLPALMLTLPDVPRTIATTPDPMA